MMTPEERAAEVVKNSTGPINVRRYACEGLEANIARAIEAAIAERCDPACLVVIPTILDSEESFLLLKRRCAIGIDHRYSLDSQAKQAHADRVALLQEVQRLGAELERMKTHVRKSIGDLELGL